MEVNQADNETVCETEEKELIRETELVVLKVRTIKGKNVNCTQNSSGK